MDDKQINEALVIFSSLAALQKRDLVSTEKFPHWNACSLFLNRLKSQGIRQEITLHLKPFQEHWNELEDELPELMDKDRIDSALELYQSMKSVLFPELASRRSLSC